jgi:hypothetical protein
MYHVQIDFLCNNHINELTKFIKNSEFFLSYNIYIYIYIISKIKIIGTKEVKKDNFL